uniref:Uncharacterized protein n=1 Tax=Amphimedon queenslandica TaxID=400682 RepID=A0A1X7V359_AMPQE
MATRKRGAACYRCNRAGLCRSCACVKADGSCVSCLHGQLGRCENRPTNCSSTVSPSTTPPQSTAVLSDGVDHSPALCSPPPSPPNSEQLPSPPQSIPSLPSFPPLSCPSFSWGDLEGADCCRIISECY